MQISSQSPAARDPLDGALGPTWNIVAPPTLGVEADLAASTEMLSSTARGGFASAVIRLYRPEPTVAFGRRESLFEGFPRAMAAAREHGYTPVIRPTGGRAVAYDQGCIVLDLARHERLPWDSQQYFAATSAAVASALRTLGVDARVGAVEAEYCPGTYSVNAGNRVKLMGTSQRVSRGARLLSAMLPLEAVERSKAVLVAVNRELGLDWNPDTFGSLDGEVPGVTRADAVDVLLRALAPEGTQDVTYSEFQAFRAGSCNSL